MAAGAFVPYDSFVYNVFKGNIDVENDTITAALLDNAYTPNTTTHTQWSHVSAYEVNSGTYPDYSSKPVTCTVSQDGSYRTVIDGTNVDYGDSVTISARYLVLYDNTHANDLLIGYVDLNSGGSTNVSSTSDDFDIAWSADGIYRIDP